MTIRPPNQAPIHISTSETLTLQPPKHSTDQFGNQMGVSLASEDSL